MWNSRERPLWHTVWDWSKLNSDHGPLNIKLCSGGRSLFLTFQWQFWHLNEKLKNS